MSISKPDWSKAPEGATHYVPDSDIHQKAWYKRESGGWMYWIVDRDIGWYYTDILPPNAIARPTEWDGTGLPPVGTKCEVRMHSDRWYECTVVAHFEGRAVVVLGNHESACIYVEQLRLIRTPEQIAAEKREREINDLAATILSICDSMDSEDPRDLAKALYDAGCRITEQEKNNEQ